MQSIEIKQKWCTTLRQWLRKNAKREVILRLFENRLRKILALSKGYSFTLKISSTSINFSYRRRSIMRQFLFWSMKQDWPNNISMRRKTLTMPNSLTNQSNKLIKQSNSNKIKSSIKITSKGKSLLRPQTNPQIWGIQLQRQSAQLTELE